MKKTVITCDICGRPISGFYFTEVFYRVKIRRCFVDDEGTKLSKRLDMCDRCMKDFVDYAKERRSNK